MDFEKKLKSRLNIGIGYTAIGAVFIILSLCGVIENQYFETFGTVLAIMGVLRIIQYKVITKNEESIKDREIAETDERNIANIHKAKSMAFGLYVLIACVAVIILEIMGIEEYSNIMALNVFGIIMIYWICYFIYNKKS